MCSPQLSVTKATDVLLCSPLNTEVIMFSLLLASDQTGLLNSEIVQTVSDGSLPFPFSALLCPDGAVSKEESEERLRWKFEHT